MTFNVGDKVMIGHNVIGYIVEISIDPFEEIDVAFDATNICFYKVRVWREFYPNGYFDFGVTENDMVHVK